MTDSSLVPQNISIDQIFLNEKNPRFEEPATTENEAIEILCTKEGIYKLAADIIELGSINPLELFALIPRDEKDDDKSKIYTVVEGNRRLCALKLLSDPKQATDDLREKFETLSENWIQIRTIPAVIFSDLESARAWLERMHGTQGGVGRKPWSSEQKERFQSGPNSFALSLLDYAEKQGFITKGERHRKLTTVTRFIKNKKFQEWMGLDKFYPKKFQSTLPAADFKNLIKQFIDDLKDRKNVHSRMKTNHVDTYVRKLKSSGIDPSPTSPVPKKKPKLPTVSEFIKFEEDIEEALNDLGDDAYKLQKLYYSITNVLLKQHTPLIYIGVWAFFETLTAYAGRKDAACFFSYVYGEKKFQPFLKALEPSDAKATRKALESIKDYGNTTKHHQSAASFNGEQLNNDMQVLRDLILEIIKEAKAKKP